MGSSSRLLVLTVAAYAAVLSSSSPQNDVVSTAHATASLETAVSTNKFPRFLEEAEEEEEDLSQYYLVQGACFQTKIQDDGDDDGNSYFYNGAYRAQYNRYSSFFMCDNGNSNSCDYQQHYVTNMDDYLQAMTNYLKNMCNACANQCNRRRQRRMDEEEEGEEEEQEGEEMADGWEVNCKTCAKECKSIWNNKNGDDETNYLECQYSLTDNDIDYYSAPLCKEGSIVIGHFYDEDCTVKAGREFNKNLDYSYFRTMEAIEVDCSSGLCDDIYNEAIDCVENGNNNNNGGDNDQAKLCKAAKEASKIRTYYHKPWFKKIPLKALFILLILLSVVFVTLSYVYYVRHRRSSVPLANLDHAEPTTSAAEYGQMA